MDFQVVWTELAVGDFETVIRGLAERSPAGAETVRQRIAQLSWRPRDAYGRRHGPRCGEGDYLCEPLSHSISARSTECTCRHRPLC